MKIHQRTKISTIINHNKEAIEIIATINPHFKKLKNPLLRKILAPRVTIEDAARIGKCSIDDFFTALSTIGFEVEHLTVKQPVNHLEENNTVLGAIQEGKTKQLDVRTALENGTDPFHLIMDELKTLPEGHALEVINTFEPTPLIKILNKKGYASHVTNSNETVHTYFLKVDEINSEATHSEEHIHFVPIEALEKEKEQFPGFCKEIDVRDMEMPLPMVTILNELETLEENQSLLVHHKKVPQYLLPELEERDVMIWIAEIEDGNVKLFIRY